MDLVTICVCGLLGALLCRRLRLPAGVLVGTAAGVAAGQAALGFPPLPSVPGGNSLLQLLVGVLVGSRFTRASISAGARSLLPASLLAAVLLLTGMLLALFVSRTMSVDLLTALFAAAPGGMTEMSTVGAIFGGDGATIAAVHFARILIAILSVAVISSILKSRGISGRGRGNGGITDPGSRGAGKMRALIPTLAGGALGGIVGLASSIPTGALVGALVGSAAVVLWRDLPVPISGLRVAVQALGGAAIGLRVEANFVSGLSSWLAAGAAVVGTQMLLWTLAYFVLRRVFAYGAATALLASAPGGMSDIVSSAPEAGADLTLVAFGHLVRLTTVIVALPYIVLALT
jgi:membrane AbrB-like protein